MRLVIFIVLIFASEACQAQLFEIGGWGGITNYFGDINTNISFKFTRPAGGFLIRNNLNERVSFKHSASVGMIEARDNAFEDPRKVQRNLSFKSVIIDMTTQFEFNFFAFSKLDRKKWYSPYLTIGLSAFFFNPKAELDGTWYELQPLGTEGQNDPFYTGRERYRLVSFALPLGGGMKFSLDKHWNIGIEMGFRRTFTDYLDDVSTTYVSNLSLPQGSEIARILSDRSIEVGPKSGFPGYQRGTSPKSDSYMFTMVWISYTFLNQICRTP